jgi:hypothetical protein
MARSWNQLKQEDANGRKLLLNKQISKENRDWSSDAMCKIEFLLVIQSVNLLIARKFR